MPSIKVRENEPFDIALRRFRRACDRAGVITDVRKKEFYEKEVDRIVHKIRRLDMKMGLLASYIN